MVSEALVGQSVHHQAGFAVLDYIAAQLIQHPADVVAIQRCTG